MEESVRSPHNPGSEPIGECDANPKAGPKTKSVGARSVRIRGRNECEFVMTTRTLPHAAPQMEFSEDDPGTGLFLTFAGMLLAVGLLMVYSSSVTSAPSEEEQSIVLRQLSFLFFAGLTGIAASQVSISQWKVLAPTLYLGTVILLILVLVPGIGKTVNGATRWIRFGPVSMQPSEFAKLSVPLFLTTLQFRYRCSDRWSFKRLTSYLVVTLIPITLVLVEPDLGTAVFIGMTAMLSLWLGGCPWFYFAAVGLTVVPSGLVLFALKPYQLARIRGFIDTWIHPEQAPYQVQQSLTTLGVGGLSGVGLGKGWQKLSFLPEANTDFVMAVVGEELGLTGTLGVLMLWTGVYLCGMRLVRRTRNASFERIVAMTLLSSLVIQAAVNMAVITALVPPKGISHPFISYGGSNLGLSIVCLGVIVSLTRKNHARHHGLRCDV